MHLLLILMLTLSSMPVVATTLFPYFNSEPGECEIKLTLEEKVAQQNGAVVNEVQRRYLRVWLLSAEWERRFGVIWQNPLNWPDALVLSKVKELVTELELNVFEERSEMGEADAIRHFIVNAWLLRDLGVEKTKYYLDLYEVQQMTMSSLMDRYNNEVSLREAEKLLASGRKDLTDFIFHGIKLVQNGTLVVLKPRGLFPKAQLNLGNEAFQKWAHGRLRTYL